MTPDSGGQKVNRKTKNRIKIVVTVLFFLAAGIGYFLWSGDDTEEKENKELTGVLTESTITPFVEDTKEEATEVSERLIVYVCGAVNTPGVYVLSPDSRLYEAIDMAGGFSAEADLSYHNLARSISDGERIYILSFDETEELSAKQQVEGEEGEKAGPERTGLINLNTATVEQLTSLPGIGEAKAVDILEYRAKAGKFTAIEEIKNVSGIGEAMFEKIKDKITVK